MLSYVSTVGIHIYMHCVQVFVFCCAHAHQIQQYLANSKWAKNKDMTVTTIVSTSCLSVGEALRLVDDKDVIQNDFVLVSADTVTNVDLGPILAAHRARRETDKQAIYTMVSSTWSSFFVNQYA